MSVQFRQKESLWRSWLTELHFACTHKAFRRRRICDNKSRRGEGKSERKRDEVQPTALTSRTNQLKAGWRRQPVWKTQGTKYGDRKLARGWNSINYELAYPPLTTTTTVRHRTHACHIALSLFLSLSHSLQSVALCGSRHGS